MGGRERRTQRKPIKCGHKKDTALQVLVLWHGRQAGGYRQDVGFLGNNKVWNPPEDYLKMDYMTGMCKMA